MKGMNAAPLAVAVFAALGLSSAFADVQPPAEPETLEQHLANVPVAVSAAPSPQQRDLAAQRVSRYGQIVETRDVGVGNLTAWTVQKNGHQIVLFSTPDAAVIFTGVAWDAATGKNISQPFMAPQAPANGAAPTPSAPVPSLAPQMSPMSDPNIRVAAAMDGEYRGDIPISMKTVDSLSGFKEGNGDIGDTVYIIIDPRCPYCRASYNQTRAYVKAGHTIKWIPAAALGNPQDGVPLAATILQSSDRSVLDRVLGKHEQIRSEPTPETTKALSTNLEFLFAAFQNNGRDQAGVPAAFFIDHRTGKPKMLTGVSEAVVLEDIFGKL
ncbi:thioredoxin domain-containing protein [Pseudomonas savastanoi]|uniref:hypothetical protein n=1 Tax=Pseudomonas savastanoi TaxID=29438 RepID=UPI0017823D3F|nr:hypothetical protein [Pseudomonas savastanoi]QOI07964.1 hypothetical protein D5S10_30035 [Pseudomonas savastanoi]